MVGPWKASLLTGVQTACRTGRPGAGSADRDHGISSTSFGIALKVTPALGTPVCTGS